MEFTSGGRVSLKKENPMGLSRLNEDIVANAEALVRRHLHVEAMAEVIGVSERTFYRWLAEGRKERKRRIKGESPNDAKDLNVRLLAAFDKGMAEAHGDLVEAIQTAGRDPKTWQASAWMLERRWPLRWGKKESEQLAKLDKQMHELEQRFNCSIRPEQSDSDPFPSRPPAYIRSTPAI
jgi:hypothetical protein